jgi:hypothetical protein
MADTSAVLKAAGLIREDVMNQIWDLSNVPLPFTDAIGKGTHSNPKVEYTQHTLAAAATDNKVIDGAESSKDNTKVGTRVGNFTQISTKEVKVTQQADAVDSIGGQGKLSWQVTQRQIELRRDVEAQMLTILASVAGTDSTSGQSAGLGAQLKTNISVGATGAAGGFNTTTGVFDAPTPGTKRALSEKIIRDILQSVYTNGGNTTMLMARPVVIRLMSEYMFSSSARVATLTSQSGGQSRAPMTAIGSVNVFITDFGQTVTMQDNRMQATDAAATSSMYFLDPTHLRISYLKGYTVEPLGKTGLSEKRIMSVNYSLLVLNEVSQGVIYAIDEALAMVA